MKKVKMKDTAKQLVAVILAFLMSLSVLTDAITVKAEETETIVSETESSAAEQENTEAESPDASTENTVSYEGEGYAVTCNIVNSWGEEYTAEVSIKNTSDKKIHNWNLMFALDGEISNIWNAKISSRNEDGLYTIEGEPYNSNISPDSAVSFGFNAAGSPETPEFHFSQSVQMPVEEGNFEVDFAVSDDWETGFVGEIGILNKSSESFKDWCITFDWENDIDSIWNAKMISHEENHYVISCEEYNRMIEAGQRVQFGFSCSSGKSSIQPENIEVTHFTDGDGKEEDNGDGEDGIDPSEVTEYVDIEFQNGNCAQSVLDDMRFVNYAPELLDVAWASSDESVVTNEGHVTRGEEDRTVTVTAEIQYKGKDYKKEFALTVKRKTDIDIDMLQDYSLSQLEQMNSGDEYYRVNMSEYRYLESIYGTFSDVKVDSYETALVSLYNVKSVMGISNPFEELQVTDIYADECGYIFKFDQKYKGISVLDGQVVISADINGKVDYLRTSYFPLSDDISVVPQVSWEEAVHSVAEYGYILMETEEKEQQESPVILNEYGKGILVWNLFCQMNDEYGEGYEVYVDAQTGEALFSYEVSRNLSKLVLSEPAHGKDMLKKDRKFDVQAICEKNKEKKYRLWNPKYNIQVYNTINVFPITKNKNEWSPQEVSAMANMMDVKDYYALHFGRFSYYSLKEELQSGKVKDRKVKIYMDPSLENNAKWNGRSIVIGYGTGKGGLQEKFLAIDRDTIAHEYSHAVISHETQLKNIGTMGIIEEAYADILACYVDGNWTMGEHIAVGKCLRNIERPVETRNPVCVGGDYYVDDADFSDKNDKGGIHQNSTVISHIAVLMEGKMVPIKDVEGIWYQSLLLGYGPRSDLLDVRNNVVKAAQKKKYSKQIINMIETYFDNAGIDESCNKKAKYFKDIEKVKKISLKKASTERMIRASGRIVKADRDSDFSNNTALDFVQIQDASGKEIGETNAGGSYLVEIKEENPMVINFSKNGYLDETMYLASENIVGQDIRYCDIVEMIPAVEKGKGKAEGYIRDTVTGHGVRDLKISIRKGINNIYTDSEVILETKQNGFYQTPELDAGNYCLEVSSEDAKYMSTYFNIKILGGMTLKDQNMNISNSLEENQMRVVLTWGSKPRDLDSHLVYRLSNGEDGHIYFGKRENVLNNICIAKLDVDDTSGYGPETTTIYNDETGDYTFYVDNFSEETSMGNGNAMVKVYLGNQTVPSYTFTVPDGQAKIWTVFKYNSAAGRLTVVNELGYQIKQ